MADITKEKILQAIKDYTAGENFNYILQKDSKFAELILNVEESDIILGDKNKPIEVSDVRLGGIARFHYHFSGDESGTKRFSSCDFTTSEYYRVLLNEEDLNIRYGDIGNYCNEVSRRYAKEHSEFEHKSINATSNALCCSVNSEVKEQIDHEIYARANAYLDDLNVVDIHYVDSSGKYSIPACRMPITIKTKDKKGRETEVLIGYLYDLDGIEQIELNFDGHYRSLKRKSKTLKVLSVLGSIATIIAIILVIVLR